MVGMSGGIASTVTAWLLKQKGYDVSGITMLLWKPDYNFSIKSNKDACFSPGETKDLEKIKTLCEKIGINHTVLNLSDEFENNVLKNFRDEYLSGHTPNPCIWCNRLIKFGAMVEEAKKAGLQFDYFATGHYARIEKCNDRYKLLKAEDSTKDQSYFLYRLTQQQLSQTLFPLGTYTKQEVRQLDFKLGFHPENQVESQDFYNGPYSDLLNVESKTGNIVNIDGKVLGKHNGTWNYTIGQRRGLGISSDKPLYVIALKPDTNEVVVGYEEKTNVTKVNANQLNWVSIPGIEDEIQAYAKVRSTGVALPCTVKVNADTVTATFDKPIKAPNCGQSLVIYDENAVLCGGIINNFS